MLEKMVAKFEEEDDRQRQSTETVRVEDADVMETADDSDPEDFVETDED